MAYIDHEVGSSATNIPFRWDVLSLEGEGKAVSESAFRR